MCMCRDQVHEWLKEKVFLFMVLDALDIATVTQKTLELGFLESKKDSTRVPLPIIQIRAEEQWRQKELLPDMLFDMRLCCPLWREETMFKNLLIPGTAEPVPPGQPMGKVSLEKNTLKFSFLRIRSNKSMVINKRQQGRTRKWKHLFEACFELLLMLLSSGRDLKKALLWAKLL